MEENRQTPGPYWSRPGQSPTDPINTTTAKQTPANSLARASMVLGVIALVSFFTFTIYPPIIFGSLSIILALLSRGGTLKMHEKAKNGILTSSIALGCDVCLLALVMVFLFVTPDFFESIYGMSYQEMIEGIEDGTLDYDDIYNNVYDNIYNNIYEEME